VAQLEEAAGKCRDEQSEEDMRALIEVEKKLGMR
jgi:hypothetical protein